MVKDKLRELVDGMVELEALLDDPDIPDEAIIDTLEGQSGVLADKLNDTGKLIAHWSDWSKSVTAEAKRCQDRKRVLENRVRRLKGYIAYQLQRLNEPRVETDLYTFRMQRGHDVVVIEDTEQLPAEYVEVSYTPKKAEIKAALRRGEEIPGARLEQNPDFLVIR